MEGECEMSQSRDLGGLKGRHLQRERDGMGRWGIGHSQIPVPRPRGGGIMEEERARRRGTPQVMERYMKKMEGTGRE